MHKKCDENVKVLGKTYDCKREMIRQPGQKNNGTHQKERKTQGGHQMKKKVISALLASTMIVSLVACGSTGGDSSDASSTGSGTTATSTAGGDDAATAESGSGSGDSAASADWIESSTLEDDAVPGENDDRAFEKFDHVVEVHYGYQIDPKDTTLPDGDSVDNNQYTRYLLDICKCYLPLLCLFILPATEQ